MDWEWGNEMVDNGDSDGGDDNDADAAAGKVLCRTYASARISFGR